MIGQTHMLLKHRNSCSVTDNLHFFYEDTTFNITITLIFELLSHFAWLLQYE